IRKIGNFVFGRKLSLYIIRQGIIKDTIIETLVHKSNNNNLEINIIQIIKFTK
ncbi:hypothetical protein GIB67_013542, partial [Kingdonia uniflora]